VRGLGTIRRDVPRHLRLPLLLFALVFARPAFAETASDARALEKKAMADFLEADFTKATDGLTEAIRACGTDRCDASLRAALRRDLATVLNALGKSREAVAMMTEAVRIDRHVELEADYVTKEMRVILAEARRAAASTPVAPPPPNPTPPTPTPPTTTPPSTTPPAATPPAPGPPGAQPNEVRALEAMRRGIAAFARGNSSAALAEYVAAEKLVPEANAPYRYAAEALLALGRYQEAIEALRRYLSLRPTVSDAEMVRRQIAEIAAAHLPGTLAVHGSPEGAAIFVDDSASSAGTVPTELTLTAGGHRLRARRSGYDDSVVYVRVIGEKATDVTFAMRPARPGIPLREWGWITVAAGGVFVVGALVMDAGPLGHTINEFHTAAASGDPSAESLKSRAEVLKGVALAGYILGGVGVAGGLGMVLLSGKGKKDARPPAGVAWAPWITMDGAGVSAATTW
jgi:tetratricopeptide (TPR) repeat protein